MQTQAQIDRTVNESGEGYSLASDQRDAKHIAEYRNALSAFETEWTLEVTQARRVEWNAEMQALMNAGQQPNARTVPPIAKRLGYTFGDIQRAKALHGI